MNLTIKLISPERAESMLKLILMHKHRYSGDLDILISLCPSLKNVIEHFCACWDEGEANCELDDDSVIEKHFHACIEAHNKMWRVIFSKSKTVNKSTVKEFNSCIERCLHE